MDFVNFTLNESRPPKPFDGIEIVNFIKTDINSSFRGLKRKFNENSEEEQNIVKDLKDHLKNLIAPERCHHILSSGNWDSINKCVQLTKKEGKWENLGFVVNGQVCLRPHEALLMMELNRLTIYFNSVIISIEQGYSCFIDGSKNGFLSLEQYNVYSVLSRVGYNVQIFDEDKDEILKQESSTQYKIAEEDELVWLNLYEILNIPNQKCLRIKDQSLYKETKNSMQVIVNNTKSSHYTEHGELIANSVFSETKYKSNNPRKRKREPIDEHKPIHLLETMKYEKEYSTFKNIFENIQIFDTVNCDDDIFDENPHLKIDFDLYFPSITNNKMEIDFPNFRIIVLDTKNVPSKSEIIQLYQKQRFKVPLMFIYVSNNMNFHAFIYRFS